MQTTILHVAQHESTVRVRRLKFSLATTYIRHYFHGSRVSGHRFLYSIANMIVECESSSTFSMATQYNIAEILYSATTSPSHYNPPCAAKSQTCLFLNPTWQFRCGKDSIGHLKLAWTVKTFHWRLVCTLLLTLLLPKPQ